MEKFLNFRRAHKGQRQKRVGAEVRAALTTVLPSVTQWVTGLGDLRLTILDVSMSADLKKALVILHPPTQASSAAAVEESAVQQKNILQALRQETPRLRKELAAAVSLRFVPEIRFRIDQEISQLYAMERHIQERRMS